MIRGSGSTAGLWKAPESLAKKDDPTLGTWLKSICPATRNGEVGVRHRIDRLHAARFQQEIGHGAKPSKSGSAQSEGNAARRSGGGYHSM